MHLGFLVPEYLLWHYTTALKRTLGIITNFIWFLYHFFSVPVLLRTLFSPWHRLGERYKKGLDPGAFLGTLIVNTLMRVVGFVIRTVVLIFAAFFCGLTLLAGIIAFVLWIFLPLIAIALFIQAFIFFFS